MDRLFIKFINRQHSTVVSEGKHEFCRWVELARQGAAVVIGKENISCSLAQFKLGYGRDRGLERTLVSWYDAKDEATAARYLDNTVCFAKGAVEYIQLGRELDAPDLVVLFGTPSEIMERVRAFTRDTGNRIEAWLSGVGGMCGELCAYPYVTGSPNISVGCSGSRGPALKGEEVGFCFQPNNTRNNSH